MELNLYFKKLLNDWIKKNPSIQKKFSITDVKTFGDLVLIHTDSTTKKNLLLLKKYLPEISKRLSFQDKKIQIKDLMVQFEPTYIEKVLQNYLNSLSWNPKDPIKLGTDLIYEIKIFDNLVVKLDVLIKPKSIGDLSKFSKVRVDNQKFLSRTKLPKEIRDNVIVDIKFDVGLHKTLRDLNRFWTPTNDYEVEQNIKFAVNKLSPYTLTVFVNRFEPPYLSKEFSDLIQKIENYLSVWGINSNEQYIITPYEYETNSINDYIFN